MDLWNKIRHRSCRKKRVTININDEHHVLCIGNSITRHPYKPEIGWFSEHGMAASRPETDYCHRLEDMLKQTNAGSTVEGKNIAVWEKNFRVSLKRLLKESIKGKDIIIIRLGENVRNERLLKYAMGRLIRYCKRNRPYIIVTGCVWKNAIREQAIEIAAKRNNVVFIKLDDLIENNRNTVAKIGDTLFDRDGDSYQITSSFICTHPNDKGMNLIAEEIYKALRQ